MTINRVLRARHFQLGGKFLKKPTSNLDLFGASASLICIVHCLAFPVLLSLMTAKNFLYATPERPSYNQLQPSPLAEDSIGSSSSVWLQSSAGCCSSVTDRWIHLGFLALVVPVGITSWLCGFWEHRRFNILLLGLGGVLVLGGTALFPGSFGDGFVEKVLTLSASSAVVAAHLWNRRSCASATCRSHCDGNS
jgi:hypothetical protein